MPYTHSRSALAVLAVLAITAACGEEDDPAGVNSVPAGRIAFVSERDANSEIYVINADGIGPTNLTNNPANEPAEGSAGDQADFDWSPDGTRIIFTLDRDDGNPEIYIMNADGSGQTRLTTTPDATETLPRWSPGGDRILYVSSGPYGATANKDIFIMNADGSEQTAVTQTEGWEDNPAWSPDGKSIAYEDGDVHLMNADGTGEQRLTYSDPQYGTFAPNWSPDGSRIAFDSYREARSGDIYQQIFIVNPDGSNLTHVPEGANEDDYYSSPSWSPDGERIVFFSDDEPGANIHVMNTDGSKQSRITDIGAIIGEWSPYGDQIAAVVLEAREGAVSLSLYVMDADGTNLKKLTDDLGKAHIVKSPKQ